jgi:sec-independent protein translocase protein TatB
MFDIGFSEMLIVAVVALVVLGPDRLPRVARQAGQWMGKLQRYVRDVKSDISRQMELEELRRLQSEVKDAASDLETSFKSTVAEAQSDFDALSASMQGESSSGSSEPKTDWDKVYAVRRSRDRVIERRHERDKALGRKQPKRRR